MTSSPPKKIENKNGGYRNRTKSPKRERDYEVGTHGEFSPARPERHVCVPRGHQFESTTTT